MGWPEALLAGVGVLGLSGLVAAALSLDTRRKRRLRTAAAARGWRYVDRDAALEQRARALPLPPGHVRSVVLGDGVFGSTVAAFEYEARIRSQQGDVLHRWSGVAMALPGPLPRVEVTLEGRLGRLATALGAQDVELENEDFNRRYRVRAGDARAASDLLPPRTMAALLAGPAHPFLITGTDVLSWWDGRLRLEDADERLRMLATVVEGIPSFAWKERYG